MFWRKKKNILDQIQEREAREREWDSLPTIGKMATPEDKLRHSFSQEQAVHSKRMEEIRKERKKEEAREEGLKLVIDGAKLECSLCTNPQGVLKVNLDTPSIQNKRTATVAEKDAASLLFMGNCKKSPHSASPCASVMSLGEWENTGSLKIQDETPLLFKSTIVCNYGGTEIKITDCAQRNEPKNLDTELMPVPDKVYELKIKILTKKFIPLGIPDFKGKEEEGKIQFEITNKKTEVENLVFYIKQGETVIYSTKIEEVLAKGEKVVIDWDGFSDSKIYDSTLFIQGELVAEVSNEEVKKQKIIEAKYDKVKWVDIKIDDNQKKIEATLRVNLKDGGEIGTGTREYSFSDLETMVLQGINTYWSRKKNRTMIIPPTDFVIINSLEYLVDVKAENTTQNSMDDVNLIYNHTNKWERSSNPGSVTGIVSLFGQFAPERIVYNSHQNNEEEDFKLTAAHEIGHEIIKSFGGDTYSYTHQGSSTLLTQSGKTNILPKTGENNLMEYYSDAYYDYSRTVANEKDVLGILWNSKLKITK